MFRNLVIILLFSISCFANEYGITIGANIGLGIPWDAMSYDYENELESGISEIGFGVRPAITLGYENKFAIGLDYNLRYQKFVYNRTYTTDIFQRDEVKEKITSLTHNIGFSFCAKLTKNPNWWSFGYDVESKGPYASASIGFFNGPDDYNSNFMMAFSTYISSSKMSVGLTLNFQTYTDYFIEKTYSSYSTISTSSYSSRYTPSKYYSADTTYNNTVYPTDTTSYYGGTGRVYVSGHFRHYKSGKVSYVRPHTRSYPRRK